MRSRLRKPPSIIFKISFQFRNYLRHHYKLPLHWQHRYTPIDSIMDNIYEELMIPISLDEWTATLTSMPKDKAAGPSKITYEMIQHLGPVAMSELLDLMNKCLEIGDIPSGWREALLFQSRNRTISKLNCKTLDRLRYWKQHGNVLS